MFYEVSSKNMGAKQTRDGDVIMQGLFGCSTRTLHEGSLNAGTVERLDW
jgi:hypothetical protein